MTKLFTPKANRKPRRGRPRIRADRNKPFNQLSRTQRQEYKNSAYHSASAVLLGIETEAPKRKSGPKVKKKLWQKALIVTTINMVKGREHPLSTDTRKINAFEKTASVLRLHSHNTAKEVWKKHRKEFS